MRCPSCHSEKLESNRFCIECGTAFDRRCFHCGFDNLPRAKFCGRCGSPLAERATAQTVDHSAADTGLTRGTSVERLGQDAERRHLTVLFCDLVGSTALAGQLDPEEWRETVRSYQRAAAEAITRFDGYVAQYLGDGIMAFFRWPKAHDNNAERAARAGLAILDAIAKLGRQSARPKLSARIGIDSGAVVVGEGAGKEPGVFGDTPNIAARVEAAADPGSLLFR
jgi:class 3 adenylate cyclase